MKYKIKNLDRWAIVNENGAQASPDFLKREEAEKYLKELLGKSKEAE